MKILKYIKSLFKKKRKYSTIEYLCDVKLPIFEIPNGYGLTWDEEAHSYIVKKLPFVDPFMEHKSDNDTPLYNPLRD